MVVIAAIINPYEATSWSLGGVVSYGLNILVFPLITIAIATIPVLIICWIMKVMPDLDYSIRLAFGFMLFLLVEYFFL